MDPQQGEGLGHGVYVSPSTASELTVVSPRLDLGWSAARGRTPGTAVVWRDAPYQVVARVAAGAGDRWVLQRWDDASAMRVVFRLDHESVGEIAARVATEVRGRRTWRSSWLLLPLLGLAPGWLQKKWQNEWGFAAETATAVSAIIEILFGGLGSVQIAAAAFGAEFFIPPVLALPGPLLFVFGSVRLALVFGDGEPVGSPLGLPFLLVSGKPPPRVTIEKPALRSYDESGGELVLDSPVHRRDWDRDGLLQYRDRFFHLDRVEQEGSSWVYHFARAIDAGEDERIFRLRPPPAPRFLTPPERSAPPSFLTTMLVTAAVTLGPASDQKRWASVLGVRAVWLTIISAIAELIGGFVNIRQDAGSAASWLVLLDIFLIGEGLLRLVSAATGRPLGSVFGFVVRPLYRRHLPPAQ